MAFPSFPRKKLFIHGIPSGGRLSAIFSQIKNVIRRIGGPKRLALYLAVFVLIISALVFFVFFSPIPVKAHVSVGPRSVLIGDTIRYTLTVTADRTTSLELPDLEIDLKRGTANFAIRESFSSEEVSLRKKTIKKTYLLTKYMPGVYIVPAAEVRYKKRGADDWKSVKTREVHVRVKKLVTTDLRAEQLIKMGGGLAGEKVYGDAGFSRGDRGQFMDVPIRFYVKDIRPPRTIKTVLDVGKISLLYLVGVFILFFLAVIIINVVRESREVPPLSPQENAVKRIEQLRVKKSLEKEGMKEFCSELSSIITDYTRDRFDMAHAEMTGKEFVSEIDKIETLPEKQKAFLRGRILLCNLVKYSGYIPDSKELNPDLKDMVKFIEDTKPESGAEEKSS